jgi:capsular exopolysaccharide synthesis family protein
MTMPNDIPPVLDAQNPQAREHQLRFIVNVLTRRWVMISVFTLLGMVTLVTFNTFFKPVVARAGYTANARVLVSQSFWDKGILRDVGGTPLVPVNAQALVKRTSLQQLAQKVTRALVQRDIAEGRALSNLTTEREYEAKAGELLSNLSLRVDGPDSDAIVVEVANQPSQEDATRLAEYAARVFVEDNRQFHLEEEQKTHDAVKRRLQELQEELYAAETSQWEFKKKVGFQPYGQLGEEMTKINEEINEKKATRQETLAKLNEIEAQLTQNEAELPQAIGNVNDTVINDMLSDLNDKLQEQITMSVVYQQDFPGLRSIQEDINEKREAILAAIKKLDEGKGGGASIWNRRQDLYRQQIDLKLSLTGLDIRVSALQRMLEELIPKIPEIANQNLEYERLAKDAEHIREQFNKLREKEFDIRTALSRETGQIIRNESVVASALPIGKFGIRMWMNFVIGGLVGFVFGFGLAVMLEIMDTSIRSIEDVTTYTGLEVIGTIPEMKFSHARKGRRHGATVSVEDNDHIDACIVTQHDPKSPISEAYRALRTNFQFATIKNKPKTIMVTSAVPGEGKTTTAVNMAVTMADCGMRVAIVDTDLRRPNVHRVLKMERGPGLANVLRGEVELADVIRTTRVENLEIISSGRVPPNPSELIGSTRMEHLMEELSHQFDIVIFDAPSILVVTDPVLLSTRVDSVVLVLSANYARRETVQRAIRLLQAASAEIAGVVLNGLEATRRHYYYYYYYYEDGSRRRKPWYHFYG